MTEPYVRFVILGHPRTGSTMLVQALNSNPALLCFGEVFNANTPSIHFDVPGFAQRGKEDVALRREDPGRFLRERVFANHPSDIRAVGFKLLYDHFWAFDGLVESLTADRDLRVVHLMRRNKLRTYVSMRIAERTGRWLEYSPEPSVRSRLNVTTLGKAVRSPRQAIAALRRKVENKAPPGVDIERSVTLTAEECSDYFRRMETSEKHWEQLMEWHALTQVYFEDLVVDRDREAGRVQQFLDLEPVPVEVATLRQNAEPLRELIANYDELRTSLAGTEYEAWFDD
jgi:LPS sulfotransferase NodH